MTTRQNIDDEQPQALVSQHMERLAYRIEEAAEVFGVSDKWVRKRIYEGSIRVVDDGVVLVPREELIRYLRENAHSRRESL